MENNYAVMPMIEEEIAAIKGRVREAQISLLGGGDGTAWALFVATATSDMMRLVGEIERLRGEQDAARRLMERLPESDIVDALWSLFAAGREG